MKISADANMRSIRICSFPISNDERIYRKRQTLISPVGVNPAFL